MGNFACFSCSFSSVTLLYKGLRFIALRSVHQDTHFKHYKSMIIFFFQSFSKMKLFSYRRDFILFIFYFLHLTDETRLFLKSLGKFSSKMQIVALILVSPQKNVLLNFLLKCYQVTYFPHHTMQHSSSYLVI